MQHKPYNIYVLQAVQMLFIALRYCLAFKQHKCSVGET